MNLTARTCLAACAGALLALCAAAPARSDSAVYSAAGRQVLRLHGTPDGMSAARRLEILDERVNETLSGGDGTLRASELRLRKVGETVTILARGALLVTVTAADVNANRTTPDALGRIWLANLQKTLPQLAPRENRDGA